MIGPSRKIKTEKLNIKNLPTATYLEPDFVFVPTTNSKTNKYELLIKENDEVKVGQKIGMRFGGFFEQPILSPVSGKYVGLEKHYHKSGKLVDFVKIKNDKKNTLDSCVKERSDKEILAMSKEEITNIVKDCALVGLGGSSFPTYIKFKTDVPIHTVLVNAVECEPLINVDHRTMEEEVEAVIKGIEYTLHAFGAKKALICLKKKKENEDLIITYLKAFKKYPHVNVSLSLLKDYYPQGWEIAMIKEATGIKMEPKELPSKYGLINFNLASIVSIYNALKYNLPVTKRKITILGEGIKNPHNLEVRIGTNLKEIIEFCGGYRGKRAYSLILGGPMMGISHDSDDIIITPTFSSVIIKKPSKVVEAPCIRCGSCGYSCPAGLIPWAIMNATKAMDKEKLKKLHPEKCVECGLCSYVCTSRIDVTEYVKRAKNLVAR